VAITHADTPVSHGADTHLPAPASTLARADRRLAPGDQAPHGAAQHEPSPASSHAREGRRQASGGVEDHDSSLAREVARALLLTESKTGEEVDSSSSSSSSSSNDDGDGGGSRNEGDEGSNGDQRLDETWSATSTHLFHPGRISWRAARRQMALTGLERPFDRGKNILAFGFHGGRRASCTRGKENTFEQREQHRHAFC